MSKPINFLKQFGGAGMDSNSAFEKIAPNDLVAGYNLRVTGTGQNEADYASNPESTQLITISQPAGLNKGIGGSSFEDIRQTIFSRYNSNGNNQIVSYNIDTNVETVLFTDITNSGGISILPLNPRNYLKFFLINRTYLFWIATGLEIGYTNLNTLASGGYGTVLAEDFSLLKPQCMIPPTGVYGSDGGQPANYLYGKPPQFIVQYVNADYNYSAWSTRSKRIVPYQENTPTLGVNVGVNNYIIVSVNIGSIRAKTINIGAQFDDSGQFYIIKSVDRSYVTALTNTSVNIATEIKEAYNPATNIYSFAFYNNTVLIPIPTTETDSAYDYIPQSANTGCVLNGNIFAISDLNVGYTRPTTPVTIAAIGYNPNIGIPAGTYANPLTKIGSYPGASGSGAGNHRRNMWVAFSGVPQTNDVIVVITADIRSSVAIRNYSYPVPPAQSGNLLAVVTSISQTVGGSISTFGAGYKISWADVPYYGLQTFAIQLYFAGASVSNSIPSFLDNTSYQLALGLRDSKARYFPLETDNTFIVPTPSYAQVNGNAIALSWQINSPIAPAGAIDAQWLTTKPPVTKIVDTTAILLTFKGAWNARTNAPTLAPNSGTVGDTYQITTPLGVGATGYTNLGSNSDYNTGDYVVYNGQSWGVLPKSFGDLTSTGNIFAFSLNPLKMFNDEYSQVGVRTNLVYDYAINDRCTLHYYIDGSGTKQYINNPCVNLSVLGYDAGNYIVKVEKPATLTAGTIAGLNVFLRLYSPQSLNQTASTTLNGTVWYEIGERITITNGNYDTLNGTLYDGGVYYKTRQFPDAISPYSNPPIQVIATDLNYSDFYPSNVHSFGRPRTYNDELEKTERKAVTITSQPYVLGSKNNGLTRYYPADVYGETNGQTSSSQGAIQCMWQRGDVLILIQELGIFYVPVNYAYIILNNQITGTAISEKLLNNGRYETKGIGIGLAKEAFCFNEDIGYMIDPHRSEPFEITTAGVFPISGKMSQYFKSVFALAYSQGYKIVLFFNRYYNELMVCIELPGGILTLFPFSTTNWNPFNNYNIIPGQVSATPNGAHCTASYNATTGKVTYTPAANYVGNDVATFTFNPGGGNKTLNNCLNWTLGSGSVNAFSFMPLAGVPLGTVELSNSIYVTGNDYPVAISITGSAGLGYSINGGAFTSSAGTVNNGDTVQVRVTSSGSTNTLTSCTLSIDGQSATFNVTSRLAGNFTGYAQYGGTIVSIQNGTGTGVPAGYNPCNLTPGQSQSAVYTTLTTGTYSLALTGSPAIPGHTQVFLSVNGVVADFKPFTGGGSYQLTLGVAANDPDAVVFSFRNV